MINDSVELQAICNINMGQSPDSSSYNQENDGIPFFQGNADFGDMYPVTRVWCSKPTKIANAGDLLLSVRAPIGALNFATEECCIGRGLAAISPVNEKVNIKYIYYALKSKNQELNNKGTGSTFKAINKGSLSEVKIPNIVITEQNNCVEKLDRVCKVIKHRKTQLNELDNLIKSRFVEMFGDIKNNVVNCPVKKIADFTEVLTGATPNRAVPEYFGGNIPWVKTGEISKGHIFEAEEYITEKAVNETNCKLLPSKTIMIAMYGQGKTRGQAGILEIEASTNQACAAILPNLEYNTLFMFSQLDLRYNDLREMGRGGNQPNLNLSMVKNFEVLYPKIELQNEFATFVQQVDKLKVEVQKSLDETQLLFNSLMKKYFE